MGGDGKEGGKQVGQELGREKIGEIGNLGGQPPRSRSGDALWIHLTIQR